MAMRLVCASICYRGYAPDEFAATLELAPKVGFRLMEIHGPMTLRPAAIDAFDLPKVRDALHASGMQCVGIYVPGWGGADAADVDVRARAIAKAVGFAAELGADHVTSTGAGKRTERTLSSVVDCVQQVLERVPRTSDVRLVLEPHYGNVLEQPEDFQTVFDRVRDPRVGLCVDTGHFHSAGVDTVALIHAFASRLYNVHLKDHVGSTSVGIGRGEIDLPAILAALREVGYGGDLTIELEVEDPEHLPRYTEEAYVYLCGLLGRKL
jgi:sugar phosphate isomerase/epimerase